MGQLASGAGRTEERRSPVDSSASPNAAAARPPQEFSNARSPAPPPLAAARGDIPSPDIWRDAVAQSAAPPAIAFPKVSAAASSTPKPESAVLAMPAAHASPLATQDLLLGARAIARRAQPLTAIRALIRPASEVPAADRGSQDELPGKTVPAKLYYLSGGLLALGVLLRMYRSK